MSTVKTRTTIPRARNKIPPISSDSALSPVVVKDSPKNTAPITNSSALRIQRPGCERESTLNVRRNIPRISYLITQDKDEDKGGKQGRE
jgi:hypothetical protein